MICVTRRIIVKGRGAKWSNLLLLPEQPPVGGALKRPRLIRSSETLLNKFTPVAFFGAALFGTLIAAACAASLIVSFSAQTDQGQVSLVSCGLNMVQIGAGATTSELWDSQRWRARSDVIADCSLELVSYSR
jgi:hypothetical protein